MTGILPIPIPRVPFIRSTPVLVIVAGMLVLGVPTARAQGPSDPSTIYRLNPDSSFQQGCFAPCMCPIRLGTVVRGTFVLTPTGIDGAFTTYAVTDVNWIVGSGHAPLIVVIVVSLLIGVVLGHFAERRAGRRR